MSPTDLEDRAMGCLLGVAVGDALGAPLEFMTSQQVQIRHGTVKEMIGGGWLLLRPGETTEDTALMVRLARSLIQKGALDPADAARRYAEWYRKGQKSPSGVLRTALALLAEGTPVEEAARRAHDLSSEEPAGNSTLTRSVPIALRYESGDPKLIEAAAREAGITHVDARALAGSAALATVLSHLLDGHEPEVAIERSHELLDSNAHGIANVLPSPGTLRPDRLRPTSHVIDTLEIALYHSFTARSFGRCLVDVVNLGGDADTTGAVAGALAGARFGAEAIPAKWLSAISDRGNIRALARDLVANRPENPVKSDPRRSDEEPVP